MKKQRHPGEADEANREMWRFLREENWAGFQERVAKGEWDPNRPLIMALSSGGDYPLSCRGERGIPQSRKFAVGRCRRQKPQKYLFTQ